MEETNQLNKIMGFDLEPINPSKDAPRYSLDDQCCPGQIIWGRYNISGWSIFIEMLNRWGVPTRDFSGYNDGEVIPEDVCKQVANAIEEHLPEMSEEKRQWLQPKIILWRTCGGYRQW